MTKEPFRIVPGAMSRAALDRAYRMAMVARRLIVKHVTVDNAGHVAHIQNRMFALYAFGDTPESLLGKYLARGEKT